MDLKLYYAPSTRAGRVRWLLEELGVAHTIVRVDPKAKRDDFLAVSPLGKVPVLAIDGQVMLESTAMLLFIADRFSLGGLAPAIDSPLRVPYLQWHAYVPITIEPPVLDLYKQQDDAAKAATRETALRALRVLDDAFADGREYLLGDFSAVDCAAGQVVGWARGAAILDEVPRLRDYGRRIAARDAYKRSRAD
ncbi:MAG TPA: glutathione S-transferase family protein [Kofleriaceae bacterium]|nr:glutathione S-transferase family protein [Kofleriaceae bacterium]